MLVRLVSVFDPLQHNGLLKTISKRGAENWEMPFKMIQDHSNELVIGLSPSLVGSTSKQERGSTRIGLSWKKEHRPNPLVGCLPFRLWVPADPADSRAQKPPGR